MKRGLFYILVLAGLAFGWASCSKENSGPGYYPATFSYRAESVTYSGGLAYAYYNDSTGSLHAEFYDNPVQQNYLFIDFSAPGYLPLGVYQVGYDSATQAAVSMQYYTNASHAFTSVSGSFTITKVDTFNQLLAGKFQFNGKYLGDLRHVTLGTFDNLHYQKR
jgi:hypothetical protein